MKWWLIGMVLGLGAAPATAQVKRPLWHTDYARARAEARRTGKPLFVVFRCQP